MLKVQDNVDTMHNMYSFTLKEISIIHKKCLIIRFIFYTGTALIQISVGDEV